MKQFNFINSGLALVFANVEFCDKKLKFATENRDMQRREFSKNEILNTSK